MKTNKSNDPAVNCRYYNKTNCYYKNSKKCNVDCTEYELSYQDESCSFTSEQLNSVMENHWVVKGLFLNEEESKLIQLLFKSYIEEYGEPTGESFIKIFYSTMGKIDGYINPVEHTKIVNVNVKGGNLNEHLCCEKFHT